MNLFTAFLSIILPSALCFHSSLHRNTAFHAKGLTLKMSTSDVAAKKCYDKVFVAGGTKGVGRIIVDKLLEGGSQVVVLCRSDESIAELSALEGVTAIKGDAFDYKSIENSMDGCDAVITTLGKGGTAEDEEKRVDYEGNANVIEAAGILGVTRLIFVTSIGCGNSKGAVPENVYEVLKEALLAKEKAEKVLKFYTNMNWTVIRPGGLKTEKATGTAILTEDNMAIGTVHREDVADLVVKALVSGNTEKKTLSCVDPELVSANNAEGRVVEEFSLA